MRNIFLVIFILLTFLSGCAIDETLRLATTTSTYDSGLLDEILPDFTEKTNVMVQVISIGTGQALKTAEAGDVDVILVHAPDAEKQFVNDGYGIERKCVMYNDFLIIGPEHDPLGIKGSELTDSLKKFESGKGLFISRGDDSGTHKKEQKLWGQITKGAWYFETGQGMGSTLQVANEKLAYTLTDRGTYVSMKDKLDLVPIIQSDENLLNPYGIIIVNHNNSNKKLAREFSNWIISNSTQNTIHNFRKDGERLFNALRGECID